MDQAPNQPAPDSLGQASELASSQATWEEYYKQASRRRRAAGGGRTLRVEKRRRRLRERLGIAISAAIVGAMTRAFYLVLR